MSNETPIAAQGKSAIALAAGAETLALSPEVLGRLRSDSDVLDAIREGRLADVLEASPERSLSIQDITPAQIEKAYLGKQGSSKGSCRCGCNGSYFTPDNDFAGLERKGAIKVLRMIQANEELVEIDGNIVDLVIDNGKKRADVYTLYLKEASNG